MQHSHEPPRHREPLQRRLSRFSGSLSLRWTRACAQEDPRVVQASGGIRSERTLPDKSGKDTINQLSPASSAHVLLLLAVLLFSLASCATSGGVFGGGEWQAGSLQNQNLQVLAVDPNHLQDIYAGDARNGIFVSTDTGQTWKPSNTGLPVPLAIHALSFDTPGKKLYAATSAGLFVSSNFARSWNRVAGVPVDDYTALTFNINSSRVIYAAAAHAGLFESADDGASWKNISHGLPAGLITSILYNPDQNQLWVAFANALYRSDNDGASWRVMDNGLPPDVGINALCLGIVSSTSNIITLFAGTNHGFFLSTDSGLHWAQSQSSLVKLHISAVLLDATQPNIVYISTNIGVLSSNDNGQNWDQVGTGLPRNQPLAGLAQGGVNNSQLFVASHGIYLIPGYGGAAACPANVFPIILILLFFGLLYYFFVIRRRNLVGRFAARLREMNEPDEGSSQNGRIPAPGNIHDAEGGEKEEK
jgi:photosystem II stability/assembly factor-like uncharacterized protein